MPFKMHKIIFFSIKKYVCLPYLKFSDLLPETHLFVWSKISVVFRLIFIFFFQYIIYGRIQRGGQVVKILPIRATTKICLFSVYHFLYTTVCYFLRLLVKFFWILTNIIFYQNGCYLSWWCPIWKQGGWKDKLTHLCPASHNYHSPRWEATD